MKRIFRAYQFREGVFRLIPPAPNMFGLALPSRLNVNGVEVLFNTGPALGRKGKFVSWSLHHRLTDRKRRATRFEFYFAVRPFKTFKVSWRGPSYPLRS